MFQPKLMQGKRILVTGGGTGLGRAMAEKYLSLGADIYVCGRGESAFVLFAPTASDFLSQLVEWLHRARSVPRRTGGLGTRLKRPGS